MLRIENLKLSFLSPNGESRLILNIPERELPSKGFIGIKGPSGIGKTTLLNVFSLLEKPDEGRILFHGDDILAYGRRRQNDYRKKNIGYLRQNVELLPHLTVLDNVLLPFAFFRPSSKKAAKKKAMELLERFGVSKRAADYPSTLSGGEKARVALSRALLNDPAILLCDEPTDALDEAEALRLMGYLKEISARSLVLMVSHDASLLDSYCDHILTLQDGDLVGELDVGQEESVPSRSGHFNPLALFGLGCKRFARTKAKKAIAILISSFGFMGVSICLGFYHGADYLSKTTEDGLMEHLPMQIAPLYIQTAALLNELDKETLLTDEPYVYVENVKSGDIHFNILRDKFLTYLKQNLNENEYVLEDSMTASFIRKDNGGFSTFTAGSAGSGDLIGGYLSAFYGESPALFPINQSYESLPEYYDCIAGAYPKNEDDIFFVVREDNHVTQVEARLLGLSEGKININEIVGREFKFLPNDNLYQKRVLTKEVTARFIKSDEELKAMDLPASAIIPYAISAVLAYQSGDLDSAKYYISMIDKMFGETETRELSAYSVISNESALSSLYDDTSIGKKVRISGILRQKPSVYFTPLDYGVYYGRELSQYMKDANRTSNIAKEIQSHLVFERGDYTLSFPYVYSFLNEVKRSGGSDIAETVQSLYQYFLYRASFNVDRVPNQVLFPLSNIQDAQRITSLLETYNKDKPEWEQLRYTEAGMGYIETIDSYIALINRASIAIFFVVTASHVLIISLFAFLDTKGRKREIGLYRSLGASGVQTASIFLSEGLLTGIGTCVVGIGFAYGALAIFNNIIRGSVGSVVVMQFARLPVGIALLLILLFVALMIVATFLATLYYGLYKPASALREES